MKRFLMILAFVLSACSSAPSETGGGGSGGTTGGTAGSGGTTGGTAGSGGTTGGGGSANTTTSSAPEPFSVDFAPCEEPKGTRVALLPIQPSDNIPDEQGTPLNEAGALAFRCDLVPGPVDHFSFEIFRTGGLCDENLVEAGWFAAPIPIDAPVSLSDMHLAPPDLSGAVWEPFGPGERAVVDVPIDPPFSAGKQAFCRGVKLDAMSADQRGCVMMCKRPEAEPEEYDFYSDTDASGLVECPVGECTLEPLDASPTQAYADSVGGALYQLPFECSGVTQAPPQ